MIAVNEIYGPTVQNEGKSLGRPVMFLRLAGCNLACVWCDSAYTWNWLGTNFQHPQKFDPKDEVHKMTSGQIVDKLVELGSNIKSVVVSGGEPMLQQEKLLPLLGLLKGAGYWVEIETNGTIAPTTQFLYLIDQINCSPKLENSGSDNPLNKRIVPTSLESLVKCGKANFKFVVAGSEDIHEILALIKRYGMKEVYLMALGKTREEQEARQEEVSTLADVFGFHFTPRPHILNHGDLRGI